MRIFSGALNNTAVSREQTEALVLAQSLLAGAGVETPFASGEAAGRHGEQMEWQMVMAHVEPNRDVPRAGTPVVALWDISVRVSWRDSLQATARTVTLSTLRAAKQGAP